MKCSLNHVEQQLIVKRVKEMETVVLPGLSEVSWKSNEKIEEFLALASISVRRLYETATKVNEAKAKIV